MASVLNAHGVLRLTGVDCGMCQHRDPDTCDGSVPDPALADSLGWVSEYSPRRWDRCPGWYVNRSPIPLRYAVARAERLVALAEIGVPPADLTDAGESLVILGRRFRDRVEADVRAREARRPEK